MAAGQGFKTFTTGEVLTAGDVNGYLMQGINVFTNATARDAAITAPAEGQFAFTKDNNSLWYYDGAAWVASGAAGDIEGVTAGVGISGGGTSGTVTVTNSMATAIDAKGDLVPGTGADTFSRLAVGANGTVLTADSAEATGLKWATPSASTPPFVGVKVFQTADQSMSNATFTAITFNSETFDTDGFHSTSVNTSRLTVPSGKAGYYLVSAQLAYNGNPTGQRQAEVTVNASGGFAKFIQLNAGSSYVPQPKGVTILNLAVGDYVELNGYQDSGGALTNYSGVGQTFLAMQYLGA
jgi:hypothetical protein